MFFFLQNTHSSTISGFHSPSYYFTFFNHKTSVHFTNLFPVVQIFTNKTCIPSAVCPVPSAPPFVFFSCFVLHHPSSYPYTLPDPLRPRFLLSPIYRVPPTCVIRRQFRLYSETAFCRK